MKNLRRLVLAFIIVGGVSGGFAKFAAGGFISNDNHVIDFSKLPKNIGPFVSEGEMNRDRSLELRSVQMCGAFFVNAHPIIEALPEAFTELVYPSDKWRHLYVYPGQRFDHFTRIPAYLRLIFFRAVGAVTMSVRDLSDESFFTFHFPAECPANSRAAITASRLILDLGVAKSY